MTTFNRTVLITGASSGIGEATARAFAASGARLLLAARRADRIEALAAELASQHGTDSHTIQLDVRDAGVVTRMLEDLPADWAEIDVLVNNAGLSRGLEKVHEGNISDWDEMVDTNVKGLLYVTRAVVPAMVDRGRGHVINIGSVAGREVYPGGAVYCATKFAVGAITQGLRIDLLGTSIRVTSIDPGLVETEFSIVRFHGDRERASRVYEGVQPLTAQDVADAIVYAATRPSHVNVDEILLMASAQAGATRVWREEQAKG
jgi:3-hydroxy acid dehydrogenase / malonic semialdehyde reductase